MTNKEQIERISKLLNELCLDNITSIEFNEMFPEQSINDIKDELWLMYCFAYDVCDTINMGDTEEQEPFEDKKQKLEKEYLFESLCEDLKKLQEENEKLRKSLDQEPKAGYWTRELIRNDKGGCIGAKMICSNCGKDNKHDERMDYCPYCGVKMESEVT